MPCPSTRGGHGCRHPPGRSIRRAGIATRAGRRRQARQVVRVLAGQLSERGRYLSAAVHRELRPQDVRMRLRGSWRDAQAIGDLDVRAAACDQPDDLPLPRREAGIWVDGEHGRHPSRDVAQRQSSSRTNFSGKPVICEPVRQSGLAAAHQDAVIPGEERLRDQTQRVHPGRRGAHVPTRMSRRCLRPRTAASRRFPSRSPLETRSTGCGSRTAITMVVKVTVKGRTLANSSRTRHRRPSALRRTARRP